MLDGQTYAKSVVSVGSGRGFVVAGSQERRYVITAAHCLPEIPPPHLARYLEEYTFRMVGPLGQEPHVVMAECVFVDTMADLAVLGAPDNQRFYNEADEYERLIADLPAMALAVPPLSPKDFDPVTIGFEQYLQLERRAWMLSLDGHWLACAVTYGLEGSTLTITNGSESVVEGMSGSPVITDEGAAMGLVSTSKRGGATQGPGLVDALPGWLLDIMLGDANPRRRS